MKIVMINGQNHKGSTYHVAKLLLDNLRGENEVKEYFLPHSLNHFCTGCYSCVEDETKCPFFTEKNAIMSEVEQADLLVFTTPNYCMAPSAPMKAFIDLTFTYWMPHKPRRSMFSKKAVVISTTAGMGEKQAIKPIKRTLAYWGVPFIKSYGISVQASNWDDVAPAKKARIEKDMKALAKKLAKKGPPIVPLKTKFLFILMANMQKANKGSSPAEKAYWEKQGWLGKERPWKSS